MMSLNSLKTLMYSFILVMSAHATSQNLAFSTTFADLFMVAEYKGGSGKSRAAAQAQSKYGGKVLSVSESHQNGKVVYKVKLLLNSGRIKIVKIR